MQNVQKYIEEIAEWIQEAFSICVVGEDGLLLASKTREAESNVEFTSAMLTEVMRSTVRVVNEIKKGKLVDNLISTVDAHFITKPLDENGTIFLAIGVPRGANLGAVRYVSKVYAAKLKDALPDL